MPRKYTNKLMSILLVLVDIISNILHILGILIFYFIVPKVNSGSEIYSLTQAVFHLAYLVATFNMQIENSQI